MRFQLAKVRLMSTAVEVRVWVTDYVERDGDTRWGPVMRKRVAHS